MLASRTDDDTTPLDETTLKKAAAENCRRAALARWKGTTPEERSEASRRMAVARWAKKRGEVVGSAEGGSMCGP